MGSLKRSKLTKQIWFEEELWDLKEVFEPTEHDAYLLLSKIDDHHCHDGGIQPVRMVLVDCHNEEFYANTKKVRKHFEKLKIWNQQCNKTRPSLSSSDWLEMFVSV